MGEMQREKHFVSMLVRFDAEGKLHPLEIEFDEGHKYPVDCWMCAGPPAKL